MQVVLRSAMCVKEGDYASSFRNPKFDIFSLYYRASRMRIVYNECARAD